jgi:hypothetical protein
MHENAAVQHTANKWIGKIRRAPDGDRAGAFYRNDTARFYVVWEFGTIAPHDEGTSYCTALIGPCPVHDLHGCLACGHQHYGPGPAGCPPNPPEAGWYPAASIARLIP